MASRWADKPCSHYCVVDDGENECGTCGWFEDEHEEISKMNGKDTSMSIDEKLDVIMDAIATLSEMVESVEEQNNEILEKLSNLSLPGLDFNTLD